MPRHPAILLTLDAAAVVEVGREKFLTGEARVQGLCREAAMAKHDGVGVRCELESVPDERDNM